MKSDIANPLIEKYAFGSMRINGRTHYRDLTITRHGVSEWWREEGHLVQIADVESLLAVEPDVLIIGTGYSGAMRISPDVKKLCEEKGVQFEAEPTTESWKLYNALVLEGKQSIAAGFHLTC